MPKILLNKSNVDLDYPICRPSLDLDFTQEVLDERITFSRGSIGTRVNRNRLIETVPANQPRFDYDPVTGECKGLLIEESRQNYELYSGDPTQWTSNQNMTLTGNSIVLPDGTTSTNVEFRGTDSGANVKMLRPGPSGSAVAIGETWTFSIFLRAGTEQTVHLNFQNNTGGDGIGRNFNLVTGQWTNVLGGTNAANGTSGYQYFGNGWYRVWLTNTYQSVSTGQQTFVRLRANTTQMQMTTSFSAWGAQLEKGAFPTSYIPTGASTVTRSADNANMTGTNFSSWYNQTEGTLYASINNITTRSSITYDAFVSLAGTDVNRNVMRIYTQTGSGGGAQNQFFAAVAYSPDGSYTFNSFDSVVSGSPQRIGKAILSYKKDNFAFTVNGLTPVRDIGGDIPTCNQLLIFGASRFQLAPSGYISRLTYYPRALKPLQLQLLTQ